MKLLPEEELIWSPIVANSKMNRLRNASGVNSYEQEFKFKPEEFLEERIKESGEASWLDLCCGDGRALLQTAEFFYKKGMQNQIKLKGVDLIGNFPQSPLLDCMSFESKSVFDVNFQQKYDLITCVHGIHYLGNKLKAIEMAASALKPFGLFIANLDLNNIVIKDSTTQFLKHLLKEKGFEYNARAKYIKRIGGINIRFGLHYLGADDTFGPNYTGQESVASYYAL